MKFYVPVYLVVDAANPQDAARQKEAVKQLLANPMVASMLTANGVKMAAPINVTDPTPAE